MNFSDQTLCILGSGLLGASLGLACREKNLAKKIVVWSRSAKTREATSSLSWCDEVFESPERAVAQADLVIICTPVSTIVPLFLEISDALPPTAIVTDVGSTKNNIVADPSLQSHPKSKQFIGAHPMAGSDKMGLQFAKVDLFKDRTCILTPSNSNSNDDIVCLQKFWEELEMKVFHTSPIEHDQAVAAVSHLPHASAVALCNQLGNDYLNLLQYSGSGFLDSSRIAAGSSEIWTDIFLENKEAVLQSISKFEESLGELKQAIADEDNSSLKQILEKAKKIRSSV